MGICGNCMAQPPDDTGNQCYTCAWVTRQHCRVRMLSQILDAQGSEDEKEKEKEMILSAEIDFMSIEEHLQIKVRFLKFHFDGLS